MIRRLTPPPQPTLLGLPLELRQQIYEEMLEFPARDHVSLLCVCKRVFDEGKEHFYRRPLICDSQDALGLFSLSHTQQTLEQIKILNVRFHEVDPAAMQPALALLVAGLPFSSTQHPYSHEIEKITRSLAAMPNVKEFAILKPIDRFQNPPSRDFFEGLCAWIQKNYTQLQGLRISVENTSLCFLSSLRDLRSLDFSGFSFTQLEDMLNILTQLQHLEELRIIGPPQHLRRRQRYGYQHRFVVQSFTDSVLHGMKPLRNLIICELSVPTHDEPTFFTEKMFRALYLKHRDSLRELSLHSETCLHPSVESVLRAFLISTTTLTKLSVGWPEMEISMLDSLPVTLRHLSVAVLDLPSRQSIRNRLRSLDHRLPYLRSIDFAGFYECNSY